MSSRYTYQPNRDNIIVEQIIDRHIRQLVNGVKENINEGRLNGAYDIMKIAENWPRMKAAINTFVNTCTKVDDFNRLRGLIKSATADHPFKIISWLLDKKSGLSQVSQVGQKAMCKVAGFDFDVMFKEEFDALKETVGLLFGLVETIASFLGPVGLLVSAIWNGVKAVLVDWLNGIRDWVKIGWDVINEMVESVIGFSIQDIINLFNTHFLRNAISYGGETGAAYNDASSNVAVLQRIAKVMNQRGVMRFFCYSLDDNTDDCKWWYDFLVRLINTPSPKYTDYEARKEGANQSHEDGTMARIWFEKLNINPINKNENGVSVKKVLPQVLGLAEILEKCNYDITKYLQQVANDQCYKESEVKKFRERALSSYATKNDKDTYIDVFMRYFRYHMGYLAKRVKSVGYSMNVDYSQNSVPVSALLYNNNLRRGV